jgi:predicted pyridoxine 5'-phosphate oxidase superfamily flavin-nucleotide-binding protein
MAQGFLDTLVTPAVAQAQAHYYGRAMATGGTVLTDPLGEDERGFIASCDSFYLATVSENGWPYIQHRGGRRGFLRVTGPSSLAFADYKGNRQMLTTGNLGKSDRVALFLMDYPLRTRLKILGHARVEDAREHPELVEQFADAADHGLVERVFLIDVLSYDWNCPKYITPRFTSDEVAEAVAPLQARIAELEALLKSNA